MISNLDQIRRAHQHLLAQNERLIQQASETAARHAVDHVNKHPGFRPRTGRLQRNTRARVVRTRGGKLVKLTNRLDYAPSIDAGARPHVIRPRKARLLRFRGRDGRIVFARRVNHPGNRPYKFGYRAAHSAHRVMGDFLRRGMMTLAKRF